MTITIEKVTGWDRVYDAARWTQGKVEHLENGPTDEWKLKMLKAEHSPIRMLEFDIKIQGIPYCNAVHFVRHHIGVEKFQYSLRDDRNREIDDRTKLTQDFPVNLWMACNAQAIISVSRKRLCTKADGVTRSIWLGVKLKMGLVDPAMAAAMVPECVYRGFCPEFSGCGRVGTLQGSYDLSRYRR